MPKLSPLVVSISLVATGCAGELSGGLVADSDPTPTLEDADAVADTAAPASGDADATVLETSADAAVDVVAEAAPDAAPDVAPDAGPSEPRPLPPEPTSYDGPLTITKGGTYSGNWRSADPAVPVVSIATSEPVVIDGCAIRTAGWAFTSAAPGVRVTIRNCVVRKVDTGTRRARFGSFASARRLIVEHSYWEAMNGLVVYQWTGDGSGGDTLKIRNNRVRNVTREEADMGNFVGLNTVSRVRDVEIAWNEVINAPNESSVEDNVNLWHSGGVAGADLRIHDNYVQGAYPEPATSGTFSGTGMTTDGDSKDPLVATAFVLAYGNAFVSTCNAAMNIAAGHDVHYYENRMITSGLLPDGTPMAANYAATAIFDIYHAAPTAFFGNTVTKNVIGYVKEGYTIPFSDRHDLSNGACSGCAENVHLPNPITLATEADELARWYTKVNAAGVLIGPK